MIRRPPRSTQSRSSAASDVYKRQVVDRGMLAADLGESSTASHLDLLAVGVRVVLDYPVFGVGPEIYPAVFARYRDIVLPPARAAVMARFRPDSTHDVPLAIADR